MVRFGAAVLLIASLDVVAQINLPNELSDGNVASAEEVMQNFHVLRDAIEGNKATINIIPSPPTNCETNQIIRWNGDKWECASDPLVNLDCNVGDHLRFEDHGWVCSAHPISASLITPSWEKVQDEVATRARFQTIENVNPDGTCSDAYCFVEVLGVTDHTGCVTHITGNSPQDLGVIHNFTDYVRVGFLPEWIEGEAVYIHISCLQA